MTQALRSQINPTYGPAAIAFGFALVYAIMTLTARRHGDAGLLFHPWNAGIALSFALLARTGPRWTPFVLAVSLCVALLRPGAADAIVLVASHSIAEAMAAWWLAGCP